MTALLACQCGTGEVRKIVVSAVATFNVRLAGAQAILASFFYWANLLAGQQSLRLSLVALCIAVANAGERLITPAVTPGLVNGMQRHPASHGQCCGRPLLCAIRAWSQQMTLTGASCGLTDAKALAFPVELSHQESDDVAGLTKTVAQG